MGVQLYVGGSGRFGQGLASWGFRCVGSRGD